MVWLALFATSTAGAPARFIDCGAETVADRTTGLLWEKKNDPDGISNLENPHDVDNQYAWTSAADSDVTNPDGTLFTDFLKKLNGKGEKEAGEAVEAAESCFAGYCDWRIPTRSDLNSLRDRKCRPPCTDAIFDPSQVAKYWTIETFDENGKDDFAWAVKFFPGGRGRAQKIFDHFVRAVRTGTCSDPKS